MTFLWPLILWTYLLSQKIKGTRTTAHSAERTIVLIRQLITASESAGHYRVYHGCSKRQGSQFTAKGKQFRMSESVSELVSELKPSINWVNCRPWLFVSSLAEPDSRTWDLYVQSSLVQSLMHTAATYTLVYHIARIILPLLCHTILLFTLHFLRDKQFFSSTRGSHIIGSQIRVLVSKLCTANVSDDSDYSDLWHLPLHKSYDTSTPLCERWKQHTTTVLLHKNLHSTLKTPSQSSSIKIIHVQVCQ